MEQLHQRTLQFRAEINQQIAASEYVQLGKRRVHDDILRRKDHHFADGLMYPITAIFLDKKAA